MRVTASLGCAMEGLDSQSLVGMKVTHERTGFTLGTVAAVWEERDTIQTILELDELAIFGLDIDRFNVLG